MSEVSIVTEMSVHIAQQDRIIQELKNRIVYLRGLLQEYYGWTLSHGECLFCDMTYMDGYRHMNTCELAIEMDEGVE